MFTKRQLQTIREEIESALSPIAAKYNCEVDAGSVKYNDIFATFSLDFNLKGADGISAEQNLFNTYCSRFGFIEQDYRRQINLNGKIYFLVGFNLKARTNYCIIKNKDEKSFVTTPAIVQKSWLRDENLMTI